MYLFTIDNTEVITPSVCSISPKVHDKNLAQYTEEKICLFCARVIYRRQFTLDNSSVNCDVQNLNTVV